MEWNWDIAAVISEFVSALAVVISLIYLAAQVRQNTRLMRTSAKHRLTETSQQLVYQAADNADVWVKLMNGEAASTAEENARMSLLVRRAMLKGFESQCYHQEAG